MLLTAVKHLLICNVDQEMTFDGGLVVFNFIHKHQRHI